MQLTKLDRWLKERFIYETHVLVLRLPEEKLPKGVRVSEMPEGASGDYRYRLVVRDNKCAEQLVAKLKKLRMMYATHVVEGKHWYNKRLAPQGGSFTYQWIARFCTLVVILIAGYGVYLLFQNQELMATVKDTLIELKDGM